MTPLNGWDVQNLERGTGLRLGGSSRRLGGLANKIAGWDVGQLKFNI